VESPGEIPSATRSPGEHFLAALAHLAPAAKKGDER
jgi:hypothetical protein